MGGHPHDLHEKPKHFLTEAEHVHSSSDRYAQQFDELRTRLGMDEGYSQGQESEDWGVGSRD